MKNAFLVSNPLSLYTPKRCYPPSFSPGTLCTPDTPSLALSPTIQLALPSQLFSLPFWRFLNTSNNLTKFSLVHFSHFQTHKLWQFSISCNLFLFSSTSILNLSRFISFIALHNSFFKTISTLFTCILSALMIWIRTSLLWLLVQFYCHNIQISFIHNVTCHT